MRFTWAERKRAVNLREHGLDFVDAARVFEGLTLTVEDDRFAYGEQRFMTLGLLAGIPVSIAHVVGPLGWAMPSPPPAGVKQSGRATFA